MLYATELREHFISKVADKLFFCLYNYSSYLSSDDTL